MLTSKTLRNTIKQERTWRELEAGVSPVAEKIAARQRSRDLVIEEVAAMLAREYPDNVNTNAFCAAIRSMKSK